MRVQCAIQGSTLGNALRGPNGQPLAPQGLAAALTESPLRALQGNQDLPTFYGMQVDASINAPAFNRYGCDGHSDDNLKNAFNFFKYVTGHTWTYSVEDRGDGTPGTYSQRDELDGFTLDATSATVINNTFLFDLFPNPPVWNFQFAYDINSSITTSGGPDWDIASVRNRIDAALNGVDWDALWNGRPADRRFAFDTSTLQPSDDGFLPFGGSHSGNLYVFDHGIYQPNFLGTTAQLTGTSFAAGLLGGFQVAESSTGAFNGEQKTRSQIQVRNLAGFVIDYFLVERISVAGGVTPLGIPGTTVKNNAANVLADTNNVYRFIESGLWETDRQIVQIPDTSWDNPSIISTSFGPRVKAGSSIHMVVGHSFEAWMFSLQGENWRSYVVS